MSEDINNGNDKDIRDDEELQQQDDDLATDEHSDYTPPTALTHRPCITFRECTRTGFSTTPRT